MSDDEFGGFLDREQLLAGSPAKRAATLLFLIEARTARLVAQSRRRLERPLTDEAAQERALAFVEAFALARETALDVSVHDLERHAQQWAALVPSNPRLQAALARRFADKYRFTAAVAPGVFAALGLDDPAVAAAYRDLYREEIAVVFAPTLGPRERLRWAWTALAKRLEGLPPFWFAYALTLTETVGASILALPIAFATLGPLPGVVILVVLGLVNVLTVSLMAESVVRTGPMRYGNTFLGRFVDSSLGGRASIPVSGLLAVSAFVGIPTYSIGLGRTLEGSTSVPAAVWVSLILVATLWILRRGSLQATLAAALAVGAVNLVLILGLSGLALAHVQSANLRHVEVPFVHGQPFQASVVAVVFGVVLMAYFGHLSAITCSSLVLERDPGGRSLIAGCAGAQATALAVYCLFVVAVNGAVGAEGLAGLHGTVVGPLAGVAGTGADVLGAAFVVLALGLGPVIDSLTLFWLAQERLPSVRPRVIVLPRARGQLFFRGRGLQGRVAYVGGSRFAIDLQRDGKSEEREVEERGTFDVLGAETAGRQQLTIDVLEADDRRARVAVTSTLLLGYEGELDAPGLDLGEVLSMSEDEALVVAALARVGESDAATVAESAGRDAGETLATVERLLARGLVRERLTPSGRLFSTRMAARRGSRSDVWQALTYGQPENGARRTEVHERQQGLVLGRRGRALVSVLPVLVAFAVAEWFAVTGKGSFAGLLSFLGVIVVSLLAGLLPVLLLAASRRKGEYVPAWAPRVVGRPAVLAAVYVLFVGALFAHGLVIWSNPFARACALAAGVAMSIVPVVLVRTGAFHPRRTLELRDDRRSERTLIAVRSPHPPPAPEVRLRYADGRDLEADGEEIPFFDRLRRAVVALPPGASGEELKVWAHRVTQEGESEALAATVAVRTVDRAEAADLALSRGEAVFPFAEGLIEVEVALERA